ncbi:MAG: aminoglycoside phosphotransferase family protein [Myxococcales bacterium]|nr:aminoglycoside phosphotransferase family protein [Myxococcales bacterium]
MSRASATSHACVDATAPRAASGAWSSGPGRSSTITWPLQDTTVLQVRTEQGGDVIVKASATSQHLPREIAAHRDHLRSLPGLAPLLHASAEDRILVTRYLPGRLVEGTPEEWQPECYRQAGALLARLMVPQGTSDIYVDKILRRAAEFLRSAEPLLAPGLHAAVTRAFDSFAPEPVSLVLTHGDFHPRNWLIHQGKVALIDFGRTAARHWTSDLVRLRHQQLRGEPQLELALFAGLARELDADDLRQYRLEELLQGLATVWWAHGIGDSLQRRRQAHPERAVGWPADDRPSTAL